MASGISTVAEHPLHHPKVEGLSLAIRTKIKKKLDVVLFIIDT
jgi:hypothetical protein